jgi:hypothetical protein
MLRPHRPYVASPDEVKITREDDAVIIEYAAPEVATTRFVLGAARVAAMSDAEILAAWNEGIEATEEHARALTYVATEVPPGRPQLERSELNGHLVIRGEIVRCIIEGTSAGHDEPFVSVDGRDLTLAEFARLFSRFEGWGLRIEVVPDDALEERPKRRRRDPREKRSVFRRRRA